jgi:hypothetical protein
MHQHKAARTAREPQSPTSGAMLGELKSHSTKSGSMVLSAVMERHMRRQTPAIFVIAATIALSIVSADAGPCGADIAQFENTIRNSAMKPHAGPMGPQTIGAQLGHEPTPGSLKQAEEQAQARFEATLARAKALDAQGKGAECAQALGDAKLMFHIP